MIGLIDTWEFGLAEYGFDVFEYHCSDPAV